MKKILVIIALLLSTGVFAQQSNKKPIHIKILETSDVHGCVFPQDLVYQRIRKGSLAQVQSFVNEQRADKNQSVVFLDNGDILQGTPFVYYYNYVDTIANHELAQIMNYMKYDAGTVGNHDIEPGHAVYDRFRKEIDFPWMAANAVDNKTGKPYFKPYTIIYRSGVKIAVLGMITPSIPNWLPPSIWSGIHFEGMVKAAKYWVQYIKEHEHPDLMIGLFHSGTNKNYGFDVPGQPVEDASRLVAREVPGFDVVLAGHDHKEDNEIVKNVDGKEVLVLDPAAHAENVAVASITLYPNGNGGFKKEIKGTLVSMKNYKPNEAFMNRFMPDFVQVKKFVDRRIGTFDKGMNAESALFGPSAFVDFIHKVQLDQSHADVSIASPLSLRANIEKGPIYVRDLFKLYRYENYLYTMKMSGQEIKDALEYSAGLWFNTMKNKDSNVLLFNTDKDGKLILSKNGRPILKNAYYNFNSAAGIHYTIDLRKEPGNRVHIISTSDGKPFDLKKDYTVAINSYQGNGGGGTLTLGAKIPKNELSKRIVRTSHKDIRFLVMQWIEQHKDITPEPLNYWKLIPSDWTKPASEKDRVLLFGK
ncbi:MAG: bifunctional metallophosphatase/5'-nucleotidase [Bacteroidales bacterium]|nr:bifunctional metallophosphatase/5'-nucleotidase [Bacteroidales bacterium]